MRTAWALGLLLPIAACDFTASTTVVGADSGAADSGAADTDGDTGPDGGDSGEAVDTSGGAGGDTGDGSGGDDSGGDVDGDGWTTADGDCDDANPTVHPGVDDTCDGLDSDCDGGIDEDAVDGYEPDDDAPYDLGSLEDDTSRAVTATLTNAADVDRYQFTIVDDLADFFTVTATLSNIPSGAVYQLALNRLRSDGDSPLGEVTSTSGTGSLTLTFSDESFVEDGGDYELVVRSAGDVDCARSYLLAVGQ